MDLTELGLTEEQLLKLVMKERARKEARAREDIGIAGLVGKAVWCGQNVGVVVKRLEHDNSVTLGVDLFRKQKDGKVQWAREVNALWTTVSLLGDAVPAAPRLHPETPIAMVQKHEKRWADQYALALAWEKERVGERTADASGEQSATDGHGNRGAPSAGAVQA